MLLVVLLVLMTGLGDRAHAMLENCNDGRCEHHLHTPVVEHRAGHVSAAPSEDAQHEPDSATHEGCNPFLCNALMLTTQDSQTTPSRSGIALAWQITSLSTLNEPDNPDRPPNT